MTLSKSNLHVLIFALLFASYSWIFLNLQKSSSFSFDICLFKKITTLPCVSCGTTTSVMAIVDGKFLSALQINPLGYIAIILVTSLPFWILYDLVFSKKSFYQFYLKFEENFKKPAFYIPSLLILFVNWIWNIMKTL